MTDIKKLVDDVKTHVVPGPMRDALLFLLQRERREEEDQELVLFRERLPGWCSGSAYFREAPVIKKVVRWGNFFFARVHVDGKEKDSYIMLNTAGEFPSEKTLPGINISQNPYWIIHEATLDLLYKHTDMHYTGITQEVGGLSVAVQQLQED